MTRLWVFAAFLLLLGLAQPQSAAAEQTILTIGLGGPDDGVHAFTRDELERLGLTMVTTDTPWTAGDTVFEGVLIRDLLDALDLRPTALRATALNDYAVVLPIDDLLEYDVIVALKRDDQYLTIRDRGPLWVIYPWKDNPELKSELHYSRSIWQLKRLDVLEE